MSLLFSRSVDYLFVACVYCGVSQTTPIPTNSPVLSYTVEQQCHVTYDTIGASFNLCPLTIDDDREQLKYYKVEDIRSIHQTTTNADSIYNYFFNIGDELKSVPPICVSPNATHQYCPPNTDCTDYANTIPITHTAWAYQVQYDLQGTPIGCWALSNDAEDPTEWSLLDEDDPSIGIQVTYTNGDYDDTLLCKSNRKLRIRFECEDEIRNSIPDGIPLYEYNPCEYTLSVPSQYGCPIECKLYNNQLCSSHGLCGYDDTNSAPRCFCFNQYIGDDCSTFDESAGIPIDSAKPPPSNPFVFTFTNALESGVDVTYDLGPFGAPESAASRDNGGVYVVHDKDYDSDTDKKWTYYIAIAKLLKAGHRILPSFCADIIGPCTEFNGTRCLQYEQKWTGPGLVFQTNPETETCFVLGRLVDGSPSFELYDQIDDPARGVTVIYNQGSWCEEGERNREFRVNLVCPRDQSAVYDPYNETKIDLYEYVEEEETCVYSFTMETAIACPYQCITNGTDGVNSHAFTVCSRQGICAADPVAGFVRCLCDNGWKGVYCTQIDSQPPTIAPTNLPSVTDVAITAEPITGRNSKNQDDGLLVAIIVMLLLMIIVGFVVGYVVYRNQKLKIAQQEDEIAFHKMTDRPMVAQNTVQSNVITDESGNRTFATIDTTQQDNTTNDAEVR